MTGRFPRSPPAARPRRRAREAPWEPSRRRAARADGAPGPFSRVRGVFPSRDAAADRVVARAVALARQPARPARPGGAGRVRRADVNDVLANTLGAALGWLALALVERWLARTGRPTLRQLARPDHAKRTPS